MFVCICAAVTDHQIRRVVGAGAQSLDEVSMELGIAVRCGSCRQLAQEVISQALDAGMAVREVSRPGARLAAAA
ncbi:MAG TPA: (2Fe-2S)-binding protein [Burkholderiaceae bacterium]|nr:(2Fe-2S)-binding protein [Burkholderiaceae bacterium]